MGITGTRDPSKRIEAKLPRRVWHSLYDGLAFTCFRPLVEGGQEGDNDSYGGVAIERKSEWIEATYYYSYLLIS